MMREQQDEEEEEEDDDSEEEQRKILYELCSMNFHILHSPPLPLSTTIIPFLNPSASSISASLSTSPAAFASFFLGNSLAFMLFGSVTFVIGFVMLFWVVGLVFLFYFVAILSNLSEFRPDTVASGEIFMKLIHAAEEEGMRIWASSSSY